jgi:hypothetical protein
VLRKARISCLVCYYSQPPILYSCILHFPWFYTFCAAPGQMRKLLPGIVLNSRIDGWKWNVNLSTKLEACALALHIFAQNEVLPHSLKHFLVMSLCFVNCEVQYWNCQQFWSLTVTGIWTISVYKCPLYYTVMQPVPLHTSALPVCHHSCYCISSLTYANGFWHSEDRASWCILIIKPTRCTNISNLFLE